LFDERGHPPSRNALAQERKRRFFELEGHGCLG
jgi:hypothetical protein